MRFLLLSFIGLFIVVLTACIEDDFTTSPSDILTFSKDTVTFDTVFTDLGTPTARLQVYNKAKKSINISEIRFQKENSNFQFNVKPVCQLCQPKLDALAGSNIAVQNFPFCYHQLFHNLQILRFQKSVLI